MNGHDQYRRSGVDYVVLDEMKREAIRLASDTGPLLQKLGGAEFPESRGSSAFVFRLGELTLAFVMEGLGTKSVIARDYFSLTGESRFKDIAQDAVAAIVNDIASVGADPAVVTAYFSTDDAAWHASKQQSLDLLQGWKDACEEVGATWGGGESPALPGVVAPGTLQLAGSALGVFPEGRDPILGLDVEPGDHVVILESVGLHANGASLARRVIDSLADGLITKLPSGRTLGEALLDPSPLYAKFVTSLLNSGARPTFLNAVTGHGFLKIMRAPVDVSYVIDVLPRVPEVLQFLVDALQMSEYEAYSTLNMGAGYVAVVRPEQAEQAVEIAERAGFRAYVAGRVVEGSKSVYISTLGVKYEGTDLQIS